MRNERLTDFGFPTLEGRLMDAVDPETVLRFLRDLSTRVSVPLRLEIGGSIALIVNGLLRRGTEDIDVADEVPEPVAARLSE